MTRPALRPPPSLAALGPVAPHTASLQRHRLGTPLRFARGTAALAPQARRQLEELAQVLTWFTGSGLLEIRGHAWDEGPDLDERALSQARAENVRAELERLGLPPAALRVHGLGAEQPDAAFADESRRVEIALLLRGHDLPAQPCLDPGGPGCCRNCDGG
jgi:outer membrane protein OmpA-like peptidoglycan-associated protein